MSVSPSKSTTCSRVKLLAVIFVIFILISFCIDPGNTGKSWREKLQNRDKFGCVRLNSTDRYRLSLRKQLMSICNQCQCMFCTKQKCSNYCFSSPYFGKCVEYASKNDKEYYKYAAKQLDIEDW